MRTQSHSRGKIEVAADRYWSAQTQRSLQNFKIGGDRFARPAIRALGLVKKAVALVNLDLKTIPADVGALILRAADEVSRASSTTTSGPIPLSVVPRTQSKLFTEGDRQE